MRMNGIPMDRDDQLEAALDAVSTLETEFEKVVIAKFDTESDYKVAKAKAFLEADGTEKKREAEAVIRSEKYLRERNRAEAVYLFTKEKLADAQAAVSARQSLLKADMNTSTALGGGYNGR
jgi:hypothetical protein